MLWKKKEKKPEVKKTEIKLTRKELKTISNLLFVGKYNLSLQESQQVITPLVNKLALMIDNLKTLKVKK